MDNDDDFNDRVILRRDSIIPWLKSFTRREKVFIILICITLLATLILVIIIGTSNESDNYPKGQIPDMCLSGVCLQQATFLINNMNQSVDPCENFYSFACDNFQSRFPPGPKQRFNNILSSLEEVTLKKVLTTLKKKVPYDRNYPKSSERKLKGFFRSCIDGYGNLKRESRPLLTIIEELGGSYLLETWDEHLFNRDILLQKVKGDYWAEIFIEIEVLTKRDDAKEKIIYVSTSGLTLDFPYWYIETPHFYQAKRDGLQRFILSIASLLWRDTIKHTNDSRKTERITTFVNDVMSFEIKLANITELDYNVEQRRINISLAELNVEANAFDWISLFKNIFYDHIINGSTVIHCKDTKYFVEISNLVKMVPNRTFHNYLIWKLIVLYAQSLSYEYVHLYRIFDEVQYRPMIKEETWHHCVELTSLHMNDVLSVVFIEENFKMNKLEPIYAMITYLKSSLIDIIEHFKWMDDATKAIAKKKVNLLKVVVEYSSLMTNRTALDLSYKELEVDEMDFFQNFVNVNKFMKTIFRQQMMDTNNIFEWNKHISHFVHKPMYEPLINEIKIPAIIIQPPLFHNKFPQFVNYGSLGYLVATDILRSIMTSGMYYDETGQDNFWWSKQTVAEFNKMAYCLYNQLSLKKIDINVLGTRRWDAIVPDHDELVTQFSLIIAVIQVYKSYQLSMVNANVDPLIPGLLLKSNDQGLFLSMAQLACYSLPEEVEDKNAYYQGEINMRIRVQHLISQISEFSEAFHCSPSTVQLDKSCHLFS